MKEEIKSFEKFLNENNELIGNKKLEAFKSEFKLLLEKYNAYIFCDFEGDTHGLNTTMLVEIDKKDYILSNSSDIDYYNL